MLALAVPLLTGAAKEGEAANEPATEPIIVDGLLHDAEWGPGADADATDEGWARIERRDEGLYIALRSPMAGMGNVLVRSGDELRVLHTSGKVGQATYRRQDDGSWSLAEDYPWMGDESEEKRRGAQRARLAQRLAAREKDERGRPQPPPPPTKGPASAEELEAIARHLADWGWTASKALTGDPKASEYFLSNDALRPGDRILVQWALRTDDGIVTVTWPADSGLDDALGTTLVFGHQVDDFRLDTDAWFVVE